MLENNRIDQNVIKNYINDYKDYDAIVLGCTHYPLLVPEFKKYVSDKVNMIDMGKLMVNSIDITNNNTYSLDLYFTKIDDNLNNNLEKIIKSAYLIHLV